MKKLWITLAIAGIFGFASCQMGQQKQQVEKPVVEEVIEEEVTDEATFEVEEEGAEAETPVE